MNDIVSRISATLATTGMMILRRREVEGSLGGLAVAVAVAGGGEAAVPVGGQGVEVSTVIIWGMVGWCVGVRGVGG